MNKLNLFVLVSILFVSPDIFTQVKSSLVLNRPDGITINLQFNKEPFTIHKENGKEILEYNNAVNEGRPGAPVLPSRTILAAIPPESKVTLSLNDKKENIISSVDIKLNPELKLNEDVLEYKDAQPGPEYFTGDVVPESEIEIVGYTWIRNYYCAVIRINTHRYNWKKKEITELTNAQLKINFMDVKPFNINSEVKSEVEVELSELIINRDFADEFRSFRPFADTTAQWIDYDNEYIKLAISDDGIYKINYNDLQSYGLNPASLNPLTFKIFLEGKQLPIFISGEKDLSFDQDDYIEFWGEKNYGSTDYKDIVVTGEEYKNYFDRYNDTNFVWFTWGDDNGSRAYSINNFISGLTDSVTNHLVKLHLENDIRLWYYDAVTPRVQLPYWQENKIWTWQIIGNSGSVSFNFDSPDFVPGSLVKTTSRLISNASDININAHSNGASINSSSPSDTIIYNFKQTVNLHASYKSDILNQTENIYRIFGLPTSAGFHQSLIDWFDVEFFRYNNAVNDSLLITIPDSVITSLRVVVINNVVDTSNLSIYKIKPQFKLITAYNFISSALTFTDSVSGGDKYLIITNEKKKRPDFVVKKQFQNLRNSTRIADYIILSNKILEESVTEYKNFIDEEYQTNTELVYIDDIYDEFSFGLERAEAIKDFLFAAAQYWQSPKPSYLTIIGDANYDYKKIIIPPNNNFRKNLVPSFGNPVSDVWYTAWDSLNINIPQMFVGRIPAENNDEVKFYLEKHRTYIHRSYDSWNKNFLFFSGGDIGSPSQLAQIRNANESLLNSLVKPEPVGGAGKHFYKTINPLTNFGPYTFSEVNESIDNGGLFISYIGHSGTQTWDNGITSITDLMNLYTDKNPLVTDFGCSTGKFAEPDIDAFGELFLTSDPLGQAIHYLGNSSWGYLSTSLQFPELFYSQLLIDSASTVGEAHLKAKLNMCSQSGFTDVNRVFNYCNFLFGDPLIRFKTPEKPNLVVNENSFRLLSENPNELTDSVTVFIEILNAGRVIDDSFKVLITNRWLNEIIYETERTLPLPLFKDSLKITIPIAGRVGQHLVDIDLDTQNSIDEIYEDDNAAQFTYYVFSTSVRPLESERFYNTKRDSLTVLNPVIIPDETLTEIVVSVSDNPVFNNASEINKTMDSVFSVINLNTLQNNKRYWWRTRLNSTSQEWSASYSFYNTDKEFNWYSGAESYNEQDFEFHNTEFDSLDNSWKLNKQENILRVLSAGFNAGSFASVLYNGQEFLPNTYFWGIATAEIDSFSLQPSNIKYFLYSEPPTTADSMIAYLEALPEGKLLAMVICDDGAQSVLGFSKGTPVRRAIEGFGSLYVDSVGYRDSWCMIGKKGAPMGTVPESFKIGSDIAETGDTVIINNNLGYIIFPQAGKSFQWINIEKEDQLPSGTSVEYFPIGIKSNGDADTLDVLNFQNNISSLNNINSSLYPSLKILARLEANDLIESPLIKSLGINYTIPPELAVNYQVVDVDKDTLLAGEDLELNFALFNTTKTPADSFKVLVEVIKTNNEKVVVVDFLIERLDSSGKKYFEVLVNTLNFPGDNNFVITVDPDNRVSEIFEDNNFFSIPFFVKADTSVPEINISFDGADILDGDYVSSNPEIKIELFDFSMLPLNDTSSVSLFLNNEQIYLANNTELSYQFSPSNPKIIVTYRPQLASGEYMLKVLGKNISGSADTNIVERYFIVNETTELLNVYNYPNPSKGSTYFTFKLTQIPDELKIKIYTVAGRLIKQIVKSSSELKYDFNSIYWDGKDDDENSIANGVYFYKVIISKEGTTRDVTEKLAIVR